MHSLSGFHVTLVPHVSYAHVAGTIDCWNGPRDPHNARMIHTLHMPCATGLSGRSPMTCHTLTCTARYTALPHTAPYTALHLRMCQEQTDLGTGTHYRIRSPDPHGRRLRTSCKILHDIDNALRCSHTPGALLGLLPHARPPGVFFKPLEQASPAHKLLNSMLLPGWGGAERAARGKQQNAPGCLAPKGRVHPSPVVHSLALCRAPHPALDQSDPPLFTCSGQGVPGHVRKRIQKGKNTPKKKLKPAVHLQEALGKCDTRTPH